MIIVNNSIIHKDLLLQGQSSVGEAFLKLLLQIFNSYKLINVTTTVTSIVLATIVTASVSKILTTVTTLIRTKVLVTTTG